MHLLLFLHPDDRFLDAVYIDEIGSAELLDQLLDSTGELTKIVQSAIVYGLCGTDHPPNNPLQCTKRFSRSFQPAATVQEDGYLLVMSGQVQRNCNPSGPYRQLNVAIES
jgi:hypothetical protein